MNLENIPIYLHETRKGQFYISFRHEGKHYRGFFYEFPAGDAINSWTKRKGELRICQWKDCRICYSDEIII